MGMDDVSPGLPNIALMLPYSGVSHILFSLWDLDAVVATSANIPGEPMCISNEDIFSLNAECYLLHNRRIVNRCDDSLVKCMNGNTFFIRRSRGFIPAAFYAPGNKNSAGFGAGENLTVAIGHEGKIHLSQYIGDAKYEKTLSYLEAAARYWMKMVGCKKLEAVGIDLHPRYPSRRLVLKIAEEFNAEVVPVQHHWAHCTSLMVDHAIPKEERLIALSVDGTGYGTDGQAWGGEVIDASYEDFERVGTLRGIPLLGGEKAVIHPKRLLFAALEMLGEDATFLFPKEASVLKKLMPKSVQSTSLGRFLDMLAAMFGVCTYRSYEGEPAMKLETLLERGRRRYSFEVPLLEKEKTTIIDTLSLLSQIREIKIGSEAEKADVVYSAVHAIISAMVDCAADRAKDEGGRIGLTGGVSYNLPIARMFQREAERHGLLPLLHNSVPNGDGGISVGQAAIASVH